MCLRHFLRLVAAISLLCLISPVRLLSQTELASLVGTVRDPQGASVPGAQVQITRLETGVVTTSVTNGAGLYVFPGLQPGHYRIAVTKPGFREDVAQGVLLSVQERREQNFSLAIGAVSESVTVEASTPMLNTQDASVSTVVDRQFADNLPMNGRSFQTLIDLTPGVVLTSVGFGLDSGQFSVNGQRAASNYWMVDGVSANVGSSTSFGGNQISGAIGTTSVIGGTNSLVSVDALQEFRLQTSTFAPEFGRTPGGQISIVTRSGTNKFHGSIFDYVRNDAFDANNWFNGYTNTPPLPKAEERQNDFGGTFSGPIFKNHTFFFFSYEGFRLRLPTTTLTDVPDASFTPGTTNSRQNAAAALQPYLNVFPLPNPNSPEILCDPTTDPYCPPSGQTGAAAFNASYSVPATLDAYSLRIDHRLNDKASLFGRYNYSPSEARPRESVLSEVGVLMTNAQTATVGLTYTFSPRIADEFRFNYSRTAAGSSTYVDGFGGAIPLQTLPFPSSITTQNGSFQIGVLDPANIGTLNIGAEVRNVQRQFNVVDNVSVQKGLHSLKFGIDYRRLSPQYVPFLYQQSAYFNNVPSFASGSPNLASVLTYAPATLLFRNVSAFAQDTWRVRDRLTLTYGLRWDTDFSPSSLSGANLPGLSGFDLSNLSNLALAPSGTPPFKTTFNNFAPRVGAAYRLFQGPNSGTVLRGGFGVFYDLATSEVANLIAENPYPFAGSTLIFGGTFPLSPPPGLPQITPPNATSGILGGFDPHLKLPYTLQWNVAVEQALGQQQALSMSYIGAAGRRLLQTASITSPNPNLEFSTLVANTGASDYDALQAQFRRSLTRGLQALVSYSWSHSIDTASAGSTGVGSNAIVSGGGLNANRGDSDFDVRHAFSAGITYAIPSFQSHSLLKVVAGGWSLESFILAHSASAVNVYDGNFFTLTNGFFSNIRPDVTPGIPLYLYGAQCTAENSGVRCPAGKAINFTPGAVPGGCPDGLASIGPFCNPPTDVNGNPLRQGDLGRNSLRGFGTTQVDFAVHRDFPIHEEITLQFRAELFNVFNHPNFGPPDGNLVDSTFGLATQLLGQYLSGGSTLPGNGGLSTLYQIGGPRSIQFALKLVF